MTFDEKFYVINSTSYIKSVPTRLDKDFKKDYLKLGTHYKKTTQEN